MHDLPGARRVAGLLLVALLAGCGGGGGEDESVGTSISTNAINFTAAAPTASTPAAQVITATFGSQIAHLSVVHSGDAIATVTSTLDGRTAQISVTPVAPSNVGPGLFAGAVAVTGYTCADASCSKLAAGSTSTVAVSYQVSPVVQLVAPHVGTAGVSETAVIRGVGFASFPIQGVRFGGIAATAVTTTNSATELRATYPALPAGSYPVTIESSTHQGPIPTNATLLIVDPIAAAATTLPYPGGATLVRGMVYDAERRALLAVTDAGGGAISRYVYNGATWSAPDNVTGAFRDAALSVDGAQLFAISSTAVVPVNPVTLAAGTAVAAPSMTTDSFLKNIVVGSDNVALITSGISTSTSTPVYLYSPISAAVVTTGQVLNNGTPAISGNNAVAVISQGDPSLTTELSVYTYSASSNTSLAASTVIPALRQNSVAPALSRDPNRFALNGLKVYDSQSALLGTLPATTAAVAFKADGTRLYSYDSGAGGILTYDTSVDRDEAAYAPLGAATPLAGNPGTAPRMIISPDGGTLFIYGTGGVIVVQPTPAL